MVVQYASLMKEGKFLEALDLVGPHVIWQPFSGATIVGRDNLKTYFEENKRQGITRRGLSDWWMEGKLSEDGQSYTAKRRVSYEKPGVAPYRVLQTMEVTNGLITKAQVSAMPWEPNLEPIEVLRRFASLRAQHRNGEAVRCLSEDCEWAPFNCPEIFTMPDDLKDQSVLQGRQKVETLLSKQLEQGVVREAKSDWEEGDASMLGGSTARKQSKIFFRKVSIKGGGGGATQAFVQVVQVHRGQIVTMKHNQVSAPPPV